MVRKPCVMANWKMNMSLKETSRYSETLTKDKFPWADVVISPPIYICPQLSRDLTLSGSNIRVAAQNVYYEPKGAFTGEISGKMVKDAGCTYAILGHSERRHVFDESDEEITLRLKAAFSNDLIPVVCVGEKLDERNAGKTDEVIERQLKAVLPVLEQNSGKKFLIAYEPVWAIGTGHTATPDQAQEVQQAIRKMISSELGSEIAEKVLNGELSLSESTEMLKNLKY